MWKTWTKEELGKAYNNSLAVNNSAELIRLWVDKSASARKTIKGDLNIPYGSSSRQSFDFFPGGNQSPIVVFIHGGFWQVRSKDDFTFIAPRLLDEGMTVALLGYSLAPEAKMADIVLDVRNGLNKIEKKVRSERGSFPGFYLLGWSAGAHLVASVMDQANVSAGLAISGIYDLEPMRHCYVNDKLQLDSKSSCDYSPILQKNHFGKSIDLFVGSAELPAMQKQTTDFIRYRQSHSQLGEFKLLNGLNHYTIFNELINQDGDILKVLKHRVL